jgi:hypothetical protein
MFNGKAVILVVEDSALIRMSAVDLVLSTRQFASWNREQTSTSCLPMCRCRERWTALNWPTTSATDGHR